MIYILQKRNWKGEWKTRNQKQKKNEFFKTNLKKKKKKNLKTINK